MKIYVINLAQEKGRLERIDARLNELGLEYERFEAIHGKNLPQSQIKSAVNHFRWWCAKGWPARIGEIGCAMSHYSIYKKMPDVASILEDDVSLSDELPKALEKIATWIDVKKAQVVLLSNHTKESGVGICKSNGDMYAEAYVITKPAAEAILKVNWPLHCPCDWWQRWAKAGIIELYHYFPSISKQNRAEFGSGTAPIGVSSVKDLGLIAFIFHKVKRIIGKILDRILPL